MTTPVETEIKLTALPEMLDSLRKHPDLAGNDLDERLVTTYFDNADRSLARAGISLRVRVHADKREQTVKIAPVSGGTVRRGEWTMPLTSGHPAIGTFPEPLRTDLQRVLGLGPLKAVASSHINRIVRHITAGSSRIEIAFDTGRLEAGNQIEQVCELELELLDGNLADLITLVLKLPIGPDLVWSVLSKAQRCDLLASATTLKARTARAPTLSPAMDRTVGFQAIAWNCLDHLLGNYALVAGTGDPEAVHQCRIAIRRMRVACNLFADMLDDDETRILTVGLKAVGRALGKARDIHVLCHRLAKASELTSRSQTVLAALEKAQADAAREAGKLLIGASCQRMLFDLAHWVEAGPWLKRSHATRGDQPLRPFAGEVLTRYRRKLETKGMSLRDLSDHDLHNLRIRAKKLRYAADFLAPLWTGDDQMADQKAFLSKLGQLQDLLGELHDLAVAGTSHAALLVDLDPIETAQATAELAVMLASHREGRKKLLGKAHKSMVRVHDTRQWWHHG